MIKCLKIEKKRGAEEWGHFYYVRHGQTVWNVENKICGATDIPLTPLGYEQARELGEEILRQGLKIDKILYSPLIRAKETARQISEAAGIPMKEEIRLKEQNFGMYESTPRDGAEFKKAKEKFCLQLWRGRIYAEALSENLQSAGRP